MLPKSSVLEEVRESKMKVDALSLELKAAETALKKAAEDSLKRIQRGETSGDVIADALLVGKRIADEKVEEVLRSLHTRLLSAEGQIFLFGHHTWQQYDETSRELFEYPPSRFCAGLVPKGGLKLFHRHGIDYLAIPTEWNIELQPHYFGGNGNYASWPFRDWNLYEFVNIPIGGWKQYLPVLHIGPEEIQKHYAEDHRLAELVLALKNGKSGIKNKGIFEPLHADEKSKMLIEALPLPALKLV